MDIVKIIIELLSLVSSLVIAAFAFSQGWLALCYFRSKKNQTAPPKNREWPGSLPPILLQLPLYNERYVVERLLQAVEGLDYPRELLTIQVLDDSTDDTVELTQQLVSKLQSEGLNIIHLRRQNRTGFKAGALQAGLEQDHSAFVAIFDADFLPPPDFLKKIIPYFSTPNIGMVQTRWKHINAQYSLLTRLLSFGIDAHFSIEQGGRQANNSFINFNGTAGVWRRIAIDEAGGWQSDCLTEDLDLSFRTQLLGWRFLFIEEIAAPSELPVEMTAIRSQQFRWTKGAAETGRKNLKSLWQSAFPLKTKIIGSFHMLNSLVFPFVLLLGLCFSAMPFLFGAHTDQAALPAALLMLGAMVAIIFSYWVAHTQGQSESSPQKGGAIISYAILFMLMTAGLGIHNSLAVIQGLIGRVTPFVRTPKLNIKAEQNSLLQKSIYRAKIPIKVVLAEAIMAMLLIASSLYAIAEAQYIIVPGMVFFALGYLMVIYFTLQEPKRHANQKQNYTLTDPA